MTLHCKLLTATLALCCVFAAPLTRSQTQPAAPGVPDWPTRPLRIVVGFGGGSSPDFVARTLAGPLSQALGQPVIVENRPGASGNIAASVVAKSTDQHTIGMLINGNLTVAKILNPSTPYDPQTDLSPLSLVCVAPLVLTTRAVGEPASSRQLLDLARQGGERWSYGSPGIGTVGHLGMELLKARSGLAAVHVPYLGNPQVVSDLSSGEIQLALLPPGLAEPQVKAGRLRAIGVTAAARSPLVPDYPSLREVGVSDFELEIWTAAAAPASLPPRIAARLADAIARVTQDPEVQRKLFAHGYQAVGSSPAELARRMKSDTTALGRIIASQGIKLE